MALPTNANVPAPGVSFFTPEQNPPAGTVVLPQPDGKPPPTLFQPITIRGVTFPNRIFVSPMCQYSAKEGFVTPWHTVHLGGILTRGPGLTIMEATAVVPEGRITPEDVGIWSDDYIAPLASIVEFAHSQNQKIAIQLAHGGRKASTVAPWIVTGDYTAGEDIGGWPNNVVAPSAIQWADDYPMPRELTNAEVKGLVQSFKDAAVRAVKAGFDVIEIHGAHGYLLIEFISPTSNHRTDEISGSENLENIFPDSPSWRSEDTVRYAAILAQHGVDFLDVSSGGNNARQKITMGPAYQAHFSHAVKKSNPGLLVGTVGRINDGLVAQEVLDKGQADVILVGRQFLKNPGLVWAFADDLGVKIRAAHQIRWGFGGKWGL
ncbi:related to NADH-dependent flavin oxidoreductase [Armillaria ostoyae]|uniref:Related to NADH-dependent flavin oxidoreductase n=1 Tax=Armillaria ostoyae TaxID=47428 RepID=A0A284QNZ0_ARMOS|nr:related to NADH-dependent flavin oxidoreductase [Armillaria ostoyae]